MWSVREQMTAALHEFAAHSGCQSLTWLHPGSEWLDHAGSRGPARHVDADHRISDAPCRLLVSQILLEAELQNRSRRHVRPRFEARFEWRLSFRSKCCRRSTNQTNRCPARQLRSVRAIGWARLE